MSLPDRELLELNELCQALIDGAITPADRARLEARLAASEEARRFYVRTMALSASLYDYAGEMQMEAPEPRGIPLNERPARGLWWTIGSLAAAAMLVIGLWFGQHTARQEGESVAAAHESDDVIARLSGAKDGRWTGPALGAGEELHRGQQLQLVSGLAEIAFDSGAVVVLEGPASLELTSEWEAVLHRGTLRAQVPPEAIGFRVSNPAVEVVDLGTEFSMVADDKGATEVFVTKGSVETRTGAGAQPVVLRETEARRFGKVGDFVVRDREQKFRKLMRMASLDRFPQPLSFAHWNFDEIKGSTAGAETSGFAGGDFGAKLADAPDRLTDGRFHRALRLGGESFARVDLAGAGRESVRTAAFWMKVPTEAPLPEAGPVLAWWLPGNREAQVEIAWNNQPALGPLGALRTSVGRNLKIGSTPLRDGQWHHVAVVLMQGRRGQDKMQFKQYVDGRLDGMSKNHQVKRGRSEDGSPDQFLWIGRSSQAASVQFRGEIDELFVADRALTPQEIKQLIQENRVTQAPTIAAAH